MAAATPNTLGTSNNAAVANTNFLRVFSGEVLTAFERKVSMKGLVKVRNISQGSSAKFPSIGRTTAGYHTPGAELLGDSIPLSDTVIQIDGLLLASTFIDQLEEAINHFDVRSEFSTQLGEALAIQYDQDCMAELGKAAASTVARITSMAETVGSILGDGTAVTSTGGATGKTITPTDYLGTTTATGLNPIEVSGDGIIEDIFTANQILDEQHVPESDRCALVTPLVYNVLVNSKKAVNRDWGDSGNGSIAGGKVLQIAGTKIIKNTSALGKNLTANPSIYNGASPHTFNFTNVPMIVFHKSATGVVQLKGLSTEMEYDIRRQGTLMVSKFALGTGFLRPEAVVMVQTA